MLEKIKKIGIILIIAILIASFAFSIVDVVMEKPQYGDFCKSEARALKPFREETNCPDFIEPTTDIRTECNSKKGTIDYVYDGSGCPVSYECSTCNTAYDEARKKHRLVGFIITSILGIIAIISGMYVSSKTEVIEWIYSGILIGGILSIFIGTISYFQDMGRYVKPFVLLIEIILIIWVAIRTSLKKK